MLIAEKKVKKKHREPNCHGKCGQKPTKEVPWSLRQMANTWYNIGRHIDTSFHEAVKTGEVREWYCDKLRKDQEFCEAMKKIGKGEVILRHLYPQIRRIPLWLPYEEYNYRMFRLFKRNYKWKEPTYKNTCSLEVKQKKQKPGPRVVKYTNTQNFIKAFMFPRTPIKGMLVYHQTGSGKTCAAVAAASNFLSSRWTVIWVSRTSLLNNVWKNIFEEVCETSIRGFINQGNDLPEEFSEKRKLLGKYWLNPVSFRTFSNAMRGTISEDGKVIRGNDLFKSLVYRNGPIDILRKTLVIFDEVHKIYGGDLKWQEKPDVKAIENKIFRSYDYSAMKDNRTSYSCKLLLMSATPITHDPMELISLINLLIPSREDRFTTDYNKFVKNYIRQDGKLTHEFISKFRNRAKGLISFLDRSRDPSQFAQIEYEKVVVPISGQETKQQLTKDMELCNKILKDELETCKNIKNFDERNKCKYESRKINKQCASQVKRRNKKSYDTQLEKYKTLCNLNLHD